jgi:hypothetical protein
MLFAPIRHCFFSGFRMSKIRRRFEFRELSIQCGCDRNAAAAVAMLSHLCSASLEDPRNKFVLLR